MGRPSNALTFLSALLLGLIAQPGAQGATRPHRVQRHGSPARKAPLSKRNRRAAAHPTTGARLCSAAQGPAGAAPEEKTALEIPEMRDLTKLASVVGALQKVKGVKSAIGDVTTHLAVVDYAPRVTELDHFLAACKEAGFEASEYRVESRFPKPIKLKGG